jgi:4-amino-4-deoxychorismate lyase
VSGDGTTGGQPLDILVDGQPAAGAGWPLDRGLHYGDGLFETMVVRGGHVRFGALHRARLAEGLRRLRIAVEEAAIWRDVDRLAAVRSAVLLKLLVTRGDALARGYAPEGREKARCVLLAYPLPPAPPSGTPVGGGVTLSIRLGENPLLAGLKHTSRLEQVLARAELVATGAAEGLLAGSSGLLVSGTIANVYARIQGQWLTPRLDRCGIAGVMRAVVLREAATTGPTITTADLPLAALADCEAIYLSNVRIGLCPLQSLDGRVLSRDPQVDALARRLERLDD